MLHKFIVSFILLNGMLALLAYSPWTKVRMTKVHNCSTGVKSTTEQFTVVRLVIMEHVPQLVALICYSIGHEVSVVSGLHVNVSRVVDPLLDTSSVIFSGGGWRPSMGHNNIMMIHCISTCMHISLVIMT